MTRPILAVLAALSLAACGSIEESDPKPRLEALSAAGTDYGRTLVGTRKQLDFLLRNSDAGFAKVKPLDVTSLAVSGGTLTSTSTCSAVPFTLAEGESCYVSVYWQPGAAGPLTGEIRVTSNAKESPQVLTITGVAQAPLDPAAGVIAIVGTPVTDFGEVLRGSSKSLPFIVQNIGNAADTLNISAPSTAGWSATHDCPDSLAANSQCTITVTFAPTEAGLSVPSALLITDAYNANYGGLSLSLRGTGR
jgi:hypothetical protein